MATAEFSKCAGVFSAALAQHHLSGFEIAQLEFLFIVQTEKKNHMFLVLCEDFNINLINSLCDSFCF